MINNDKIKVLKDSLGFGDDLNIMAISSSEKALCEKAHIPVYHGRLFKETKDAFGNTFFNRVNDNTVVLGGAITALEKLGGVQAKYRTPTFNHIMNYFPTKGGAEQSAEEDWADEPNSHLCLYAVGVGGAPDSFGIVYDPDFKQTNISGIIPFRVNNSPSLDVPGILPGPDNLPERQKYSGLVQNGENYFWYLKNFEKEVSIRSLWKNAPDLTKDGTEIKSDADVNDGPDGTGIESFIECEIRIDPNDIRPYFEATGNLAMARFNSIALFTGRKHVLAEDKFGYTNVRLFSVVNFDNESVKLPTETRYIYRIYSAL